MTEQQVETTPAATTADASGSDTEAPAAAPDLESEVEKWRTLAKKHEGRAKANADAAAKYAALEEAQKTDQEKAQELERRAADAERKALRLQVLAEASLPPDAHQFVSGQDEDELRTNVAELNAFIEKIKADVRDEFRGDKRSVDVGLGSRQTEPVQSMNDIFRKAAGRA